MKGTILKGKKSSYAITSFAGEGGVGTVYKSRDIASGQTVAVKLLHSKRFPLTDVQRKRFHQEIEATTNAISDYVVAGIDRGTHNDEPFLVMEWMDGGTLQEYISKGGYDSNAVIKITCQLLKAFRDLRRLAIIHRDIKPNNVMLDSVGRIKLSDLGVARDISTSAFLTATEERLGSLLYISERQRFNPELVSSRDDFYSLCIVLYELISGRRIHTRNVTLKYLRSPTAPMALSILVDKGMEDSDEWEKIHDELFAYLDIDSERISHEYTGSVLVPDTMLNSRISETIKKLTKSNLTASLYVPEEVDEMLVSIVATIKRACEGCSIEFEASGLFSWMDGEIQTEDGLMAVHFGSFCGDALETLLLETGLDDHINDGNLFGWIEFEAIDDGGFQISGISGKRLFFDLSYMPEDIFDRQINGLDEPTKVFLRKVGRGIAIGAAFGLLERIDDTCEEIKNENTLST